jgi:hypothetical protein
VQEASAESKYLNGLGIARERKAIVDGLRGSVEQFSHDVAGTSPQDVMDLILLTQYFGKPVWSERFAWVAVYGRDCSRGDVSRWGGRVDTVHRTTWPGHLDPGRHGPHTIHAAVTSVCGALRGKAPGGP